MATVTSRVVIITEVITSGRSAALIDRVGSHGRSAVPRLAAASAV